LKIRISNPQNFGLLWLENVLITYSFPK